MDRNETATNQLSEALRGALRETAWQLAIALVRHGGEVRGATMSSIMSVALEPPIIALSVGRARWIHEALAVEGVEFSLSLLAAGQEPLADRFASSTARETGVHPVTYRTTPAGHPALEGSLATVECRVRQLVPAGDHMVLIAAVTGCEPGDGDEPLLWQRSAYRYLER